MTSCMIKLNTLEKVKSFVNQMSREEDCYKLICGHYTVNATSILGILSLDLTRPIKLQSSNGKEIPEAALTYLC